MRIGLFLSVALSLAASIVTVHALPVATAATHIIWRRATNDKIAKAIENLRRYGYSTVSDSDLQLIRHIRSMREPVDLADEQEEVRVKADADEAVKDAMDKARIHVLWLSASNIEYHRMKKEFEDTGSAMEEKRRGMFHRAVGIYQVNDNNQRNRDSAKTCVFDANFEARQEGADEDLKVLMRTWARKRRSGEFGDSRTKDADMDLIQEYWTKEEREAEAAAFERAKILSERMRLKYMSARAKAGI